MTPERFWAYRNLRGPGELALVLLLAFGSSFLLNFGFWDDYRFLAFQAYGWEHPFFNIYFFSGRPVAAILTERAFAFAGTIDALIWLRLFAFIWVSIFAYLLYWDMRRSGIEERRSLMLSSLATIGPGMIVFVAWANCFSYPMAAVFGYVAGLLFLASASGTRSLTSRFTLAALGFLIALLVGSIYQPLMGVAIIPLVLRILLQPTPPRWTASAGVLGLLGLVQVAYLIGFRLLISALADGNPNATRGELSFNLPERLLYFLQVPFGDSLLAWTRFFPSPFQWILGPSILLLFVLGIATWWKERKEERCLRLAVTLLAAGIALAPILVVKEAYTPPRTLVVLHMLIAIPWSLAATARFSDVTRSFANSRVILFLAALAAGWTHHYGLAKPSAEEYARFRGATAAFSHQPPVTLFLMPGDKHNPLSPVLPYHSFGLLSSATEAVPIPLTALLLAEHFEQEIFYGWVIMSRFGQAGDPSLLPHIDARRVLTGNVGGPLVALEASPTAVELPGIGLAEPFHNGWHYAETLGYFRIIEELEPGDYSIEHPQIGRLQVKGNEAWETEPWGRIQPISGERYAFTRLDHPGAKLRLVPTSDGAQLQQDNP